MSQAKLYTLTVIMVNTKKKKQQLYPQQYPVKMLFNEEHRNENSVK
jgi:hypothetical protein